MDFDMDKMLKVFKDMEDNAEKRRNSPKKGIKRESVKHPWEELSEDEKEGFFKEVSLEWCCEQRKGRGVIRNKLTVYYEVWKDWKERGE